MRKKIERKEHLTLDGLRKIVAIKGAINLGLSDKLKLFFPDIVPVERPIVENPKIKDPNWLAGFTEAEGCLFINIYKSQTKLGETVKLHFEVDQHMRDDALLISFIYFFLIAGQQKKNKDVSLYRVTKLDDIANKIIPFFKKK